MVVYQIKQKPLQVNKTSRSKQATCQQVCEINKTTIPPRTRQSHIPRANIAPSNAELAQQITLLTAVVTNLVNAITINQAPPAAAAPPAAVMAFATSPGVAAVEELIDYTTKHGASLYE